MSNDRITNATRRARSNAQDELSGQDTNGRLSLDHLEWLVVDEADVMFDRDFVDTTEAIIDHIVEARRGTPSATNDGQLTTNSLPFNLILSSATIPVSLSNYLDKNIPQTVRLASPRIHQLPKRLKTEYVQLTDGNKMASIAKKIESVWAEDAAARAARKPQGQSTITRGKSKVVVFCNNIRGAKKLSEYLEKKNISSLVMGGIDGDRFKGSNKHLAGFLKPAALSSTLTNHTPTPAEGPRVLITTSLLSRGLDFDPSITHVFVADEPRSAVDFIHRAGRTGRAGNVGTVVLFEKGSRGARRAAGKATRAEDFGKIRKSRH
ncbi:RNA helicase [Tulasnella sp. 403]|nr:RNA helicase [Tulasnella sp. 403]